MHIAQFYRQVGCHISAQITILNIISISHSYFLSHSQDEMEKWVSDTFYSYFPSFNKSENDKKSMLSRARQAEYQEYLKNVNHLANVVNYQSRYLRSL